MHLIIRNLDVKICVV